jgi:heme-degrading monooxygenase HmoA
MEEATHPSGQPGIDENEAAEAWPVVVISRFTIANGMDPDVQAAFRQRPHLVDQAPGFLGMEVMSPEDNSSEVLLFTRWRDAISYRNWHRGHGYHASHEGIPKGLKLVPGKTEVRVFRVFAE